MNCFTATASPSSTPAVTVPKEPLPSCSPSAMSATSTLRASSSASVTSGTSSSSRARVCCALLSAVAGVHEGWGGEAAPIRFQARLRWPARGPVRGLMPPSRLATPSRRLAERGDGGGFSATDCEATGWEAVRRGGGRAAGVDLGLAWGLTGARGEAWSSIRSCGGLAAARSSRGTCGGEQGVPPGLRGISIAGLALRGLMGEPPLPPMSRGGDVAAGCARGELPLAPRGLAGTHPPSVEGLLAARSLRCPARTAACVARERASCSARGDARGLGDSLSRGLPRGLVRGLPRGLLEKAAAALDQILGELVCLPDLPRERRGLRGLRSQAPSEEPSGAPRRGLLLEKAWRGLPSSGLPRGVMVLARTGETSRFLGRKSRGVRWRTVRWVAAADS
mmetsp:Transcript_4006/g.14159  ORF Transcript_4006/g.14159 Transcript_4006/m.14159 type:complete len:393 (+) Transcript_4006:1018-2196(+)